MPRTKRTRTATLKPASAGGLWNWLVDSLYRPRVLILVAFLAISPVIYGLVIKSFPSLNALSGSRFTVSDVDLVERPAWVPEDVLERAWKKAKLPDALSIHESGLVQRLAKVFEKSPWVETVERIELRPLAAVYVSIRFRRPIAFVRTYNGLFPIDRNGVLLPPSDFTAKDRYRFPLISSVYSVPQGPAGTHWGDLGMIGAARLAELLVPDGNIKTYWARFGFDSIEIPRPRTATRKLDEIEYRIRTKGGSLIVWGDAPGIDRPREPGSEQKLKRIEKYWTDFGSFQSPHGPYLIDIRHWNSTVREPIASREKRSF